MSDSSPTRGKDQTVLPPPTPFDPEQDQHKVSEAPTGTVVLLLAGEADPRWSASSAIELCTVWARSGRRLVLADLHFEEPVLHQFIGDGNLEGVVDVFLYGASISRSARPVPGRGFYLIPAGTYPADEGGLYKHARWPKLIAGFRDSSASLVLFAPAAAAEVGALAEWASEAYLLGAAPDSPGAVAVAEAGVPVRARLLPPEARPAAAPAGTAAGASETRAFAPPPRAEDSDELHLPPPPVRVRRGGRSITFALWLALTIIVLMAIGSVIGRLRPDLLPWIGGDATPAAEQSQAGPAPGNGSDPIASAAEPLPYSVQISAFNSMDAALERLLIAREALEGTPVFLSPEEIDGIVYYKLLAGALPDSGAARRFAESLTARGIVPQQDATASMTLVQAAPLAFQLSEYEDAVAAGSAVDSLLERNIPAYAVPVPGPERPRWQLYAGAFRDSTAAEAMRSLLGSAGVSPPLVTRRGVPSTEVE